MAIEVIETDRNRLSIELRSATHDALSTTFGMLHGISKIVAGKDESRFSDGELYIHIDGDPSKFCISELSFNTTRATAIAFAELSTGLERAGETPQTGCGEISLILLLDESIPDSTLARAGITATEAITAVVQDLRLRYDGFNASGSVRQDILIVRNNDSPVQVRGAGKHSKMGELIGRSTIEAVSASASENGVDIRFRMSVTEMLAEQGFDQERLFRMSGTDDLPAFLGKILDFDSDPRLLGAVSAVLHLNDEAEWGLVDKEVAMGAALGIISTVLGPPVHSDGIMDTLAATLVRKMAG